MQIEVKNYSKKSNKNVFVRLTEHSVKLTNLISKMGNHNATYL